MENKNRFSELVKNGYVLLDGAMGTMLQKNGLKLGELPENFNIINPDLIEKIHTEYAVAGANIISTNTFGANSHKLQGSQYSVEEIIKASIVIANKVSDKYNCLTALDIGPIGEMLEPNGSLSFEGAYDIFKEQVVNSGGADLIIIETMTDLSEMRAAVLAVKENSNLPVFCTMTFEPEEENCMARTFLGVSPREMAIVLDGLNVDAVGVNCSLAPSQLKNIVKTFINYTNLPIIVKPNAGLPNLNSDEYDVSKEQFSKDIGVLLEMGVQIVGGCCGTTPEYIAQISDEFKKRKFIKRDKIDAITAVCSATEYVPIDKIRIVGERLNPTGKKLLKEALRNSDIDYILKTALTQIEAGADILDVNVGIPDIDEKAVMVDVVNALQGFLSKPLQIDSSNKDVIESALRAYNGKSIVNSVNGEDEVLDEILPIIKKYGACVIGLTLDKNGIPKTAKQRFEIAKHILEKAEFYGIKKTDVIIDCLTLTASAEQEGVNETLKAIKLVKENLGLKTTLGVSNISFGLPNRELVTSVFLTLALQYGLDLPIVNPNIKSITDSIYTFNMLKNNDKNCTEYIEYCNKYVETLSTQLHSKPKINDMKILSTPEKILSNAIKTGLKNEAGKCCEILLKTTDSMVIVNDILLPALDEVGELFGKGKLFLPQLILSAQSVETAFDIIKSDIKSKPISRGKIILATVKGDIHDIGKNIVKVILQNYGFTVIDLGKDVQFDLILDTVEKHKPILIGLSALMTTTVKNMETTIKLLKDRFPNCKIAVGGAVLTESYSRKIGADFYAKDAKVTADIAKSLCIRG